MGRFICEIQFKYLCIPIEEAFIGPKGLVPRKSEYKEQKKEYKVFNDVEDVPVNPDDVPPINDDDSDIQNIFVPLSPDYVHPINDDDIDIQNHFVPFINDDEIILLENLLSVPIL